MVTFLRSLLWILVLSPSLKCEGEFLSDSKRIWIKVRSDGLHNIKTGQSVKILSYTFRLWLEKQFVMFPLLHTQ